MFPHRLVPEMYLDYPDLRDYLQDYHRNRDTSVITPDKSENALPDVTTAKDETGNDALNPAKSTSSPDEDSSNS